MKAGGGILPGTMPRVKKRFFLSRFTNKDFDLFITLRFGSKRTKVESDYHIVEPLIDLLSDRFDICVLC